MFTPLVGEVTIPKVNSQKDSGWGFAVVHPLEPDGIGVGGMKKHVPFGALKIILMAPTRPAQIHYRGRAYVAHQLFPQTTPTARSRNGTMAMVDRFSKHLFSAEYVCRVGHFH